MARVSFQRGKKEDLSSVGLKDGQLSLTVDEGKMYYDFMDEDGVLKRRQLYPGSLTFGDIVFDGTTDINIPIYKGETDLPEQSLYEGYFNQNIKY